MHNIEIFRCYLFCIFLFLRAGSITAFIPTFDQTNNNVFRKTTTGLQSSNKAESSENKETLSYSLPSSRREFFSKSVVTTASSLLGGVSTLAIVQQKPAIAQDGKAKVLVLGGTGFVGSQVVNLLQDQGYSVIATSRNGRDGTVALDVTKEKNIANKVETLASGCIAVISCIGAIGTDTDEIVNAATGLAANGAKAAGVKQFVYITVAPEVADFARDIDFLKGYLSGKQFSRNSVLQAFGDNAVFIEPTFIYGGGSFELSPPRVATFYGQFIEGLLSSSPIRSIERLLSPGLVKIALEPPVPVEAIASASVAGALGKTTPGVALDTYDKIKQAAKL